MFLFKSVGWLVELIFYHIIAIHSHMLDSRSYKNISIQSSTFSSFSDTFIEVFYLNKAFYNGRYFPAIESQFYCVLYFIITLISIYILSDKEHPVNFIVFCKFFRINV